MFVRISIFQQEGYNTWTKHQGHKAVTRIGTLHGVLTTGHRLALKHLKSLKTQTRYILRRGIFGRQPEYIHTQPYTQVGFLLQLSKVLTYDKYTQLCFHRAFSTLLLSDSVGSHRLGDATPKSSLADGAQYLHLSMLQHPDNFSERRTDIRVWIPAPCHDLAKGGQAVLGYGWADALVHHSESGLYCCHVSKREHAGYKFPQHNAKAIDINFLVIWPVLNHLSARWKSRCQESSPFLMYMPEWL